MSMRRAHIPPSPPRQPPNRWRLAVFSLGSPEFTQSVQELVTQHLQRHANRASTWRDQNGGVEEVAPLDVGSVWELQGLGIDIVRGSQEKTWGTTVNHGFSSLGSALDEGEGVGAQRRGADGSLVYRLCGGQPQSSHARSQTGCF